MLESIRSTKFIALQWTRPVLALLLNVIYGAAEARATVNCGVGFSTTTGGRQVPSLELGWSPNDNWMLWSMWSGVRTAAYYSSGYQLSALRTKNWGDFWFGSLNVGFGPGIYYGEKAVYKKVDATGSLSGPAKRQDKLVGAAYRVAFVPIKNTHFSIEYLMGIGPTTFIDLWKDVGLVSVGFEL